MTTRPGRPAVAIVVVVAVAAALAAWWWTGDAAEPAAGSALAPSAGLQASVLVARVVRDVSAAFTVGNLVLISTVLPSTAAGSPADLGALRARTLRTVAAAAWAWAAAGAVWLVLSYCALVGTSPVPSLLDGTLAPQVAYYVAEFDIGRASALSAVLAAAVAVASRLTRRTTPAAWLTTLAVLALLPPAFTGHSTTAGDHGAAVDTLAVHVVAASIWAGGLAGLGLIALRRRETRPAAAPRAAGPEAYALSDSAWSLVLRRYSRLALGCYAAVALSGTLAAVVRVPSVAALAGPYGALLAAKITALAALGAAGALQRRRLHVDPPVRRGFLRLATAEIAILAVSSGLAAVLSATPISTEVTLPATDATTVLLGYPMPTALDAASWFTRWRLDSTWGPVAVIAAGVYLLGVRRLRRRGDSWPPGRTAAWLGGCAALLWATNGAPGVYGDVLFSMHMVEHMTVGMLVPVLLVVAAPITLALRTLNRRTDGSRGPREWLLELVHARYLRLITRPPVAGALLVGSLLGFYYTPVFVIAMSTHTGHVLMTAHFIAVGYLFAWVICGPDPGPARPTYPLRLVMLIVTMAFHAFLGVSMMSGREILGEAWFSQLERPWGPSLAQDQYLGGALAWGLGDYPVAILTAALAVAWIRSDNRESRRYDRKATLDDDAELKAYNAYLQSIAAQHEAYERRTRAPAGGDTRRDSQRRASPAPGPDDNDA
ncbi:cytochrome c oxidase assembly protein [Kineosporia sp. R_H_3]|uniref:cytochrome c oxidase assembly protein n=1 Tax=Kineosporia sp. R_H_3 TaxID=1961848 RepID=UPI0013040CD3|nr:cytochrome c oxidase assembly protein [Kineosporia sp. R_H_3]